MRPDSTAFAANSARYLPDILGHGWTDRYTRYTGTGILDNVSLHKFTRQPLNYQGNANTCTHNHHDLVSKSSTPAKDDTGPPRNHHLRKWHFFSPVSSERLEVHDDTYASTERPQRRSFHCATAISLSHLSNGDFQRSGRRSTSILRARSPPFCRVERKRTIGDGSVGTHAVPSI